MVENILDRTEEATSPPGMEELPPPGFQGSTPSLMNNDCIHNIAPPIDHGIMHHQMSQQTQNDIGYAVTCVDGLQDCEAQYWPPPDNQLHNECMPIFTPAVTTFKKKSRKVRKKVAYKHVPHKEKPPHIVEKRNARERRRVEAVNSAFVRLRRAVPIENKRGKRVSKVKVLKKALDYIQGLQDLIDQHDGKEPLHTRTQHYDVMFAF